MFASSKEKYDTFDDNVDAVETTELLRPITNYSPRRRCKSLTRCIYSLFVFLALCIIALFALGTSLFWGAVTPPFRDPPKDWSRFRNQTWAVGIDLSAGYITAAIAFNNGTIINIEMTQQSPPYNDVLARLSLESSVHPTPPYYNRTAQWQDLSKQWKRWFRKKVGLPASDDVGALLFPLLRLRLDIDTWLKAHGLDQFQVAFLTVPHLPALYMEDLVDLAWDVGLQILTLPCYIYRSGDSAQWPVSHVNTAMAGMGLGLDGVFSPRSEREEEEPWNENVFSVLFTDHALTAHVSPILFAPHFYAAGGIANFSLGLESSTPENNETYWEEIRQALRMALYSYQRGHELGRVIVHGEHAENEIFGGILREEVKRAQWSDEDGKQPVWYRRETVFAASRGAAVFGNWCQRGLGRADWSGCFPDLRPRAPGW